MVKEEREMKKFNTTAVCVPSKHYMVNLSERVAEIKGLVEEGRYFTINRARQFGKTTTINLLCQSLAPDHVVISLDFQDIEDGSFKGGGEFSKAFARILLDAHEFDGLQMPVSIEGRLRELDERDAADVKFLEEEGRERFITYIAPIINGTGTYDIEPQTRDHRRMDLVIHYLGRRYIIELKIWRGDRYKQEGEKQISEYLDYFGLSTGYMLSFNFNQKKKTGVERVQIGEKVLFEGTV